MNRLLKFPRPKKAAGRGYIRGRRENIESDSIDEHHDSEDDIDGIYIDRRHRFEVDNQSAGSTQSDADHDRYERNIDSNDHVSIDFEADAIYRNVIASASASKPTTSSTSGDTGSKKSYLRKKATSAVTTATSPKKIRTNINLNINSSSTVTNVPKMATRYRFRDLLLGDFSFNDDGER